MSPFLMARSSSPRSLAASELSSWAEGMWPGLGQATAPPLAAAVAVTGALSKGAQPARRRPALLNCRGLPSCQMVEEAPSRYHASRLVAMLGASAATTFCDVSAKAPLPGHSAKVSCPAGAANRSKTWAMPCGDARLRISCCRSSATQAPYSSKSIAASLFPLCVAKRNALSCCAFTWPTKAERSSSMRRRPKCPWAAAECTACLVCFAKLT
mmetsp:Transcript_44224/g.94223  ORF Transcript_44224/g.94223 Transcript_44224/m.94223 type:complete len:212 (+) Transcript_44224:472-1107(+)